jgi:hypothetical protein
MKRVVAIVFAIVVAAVLIANRSESIFGADSSGYANLAWMLDRGETTGPLPVASHDPPLGFVPLPSGRMASFYPIGLPIHLALFARIGGWAHAPFLVSPLAGVALVMLTFWLGRRLHSELAGLVAALLMGFCAVFVFQALQPMSDVLAAMWSVAAVVAAVEGRERPRFDLVAGFCFGVAVLVRPTSMLMVLPLAFVVRQRLSFLLGGIPAALILAWYNLDAFGSLLASGYGAGGATREFALAYFAPRALHYARWTIELLSPVAILAAIGGIALIGRATGTVPQATDTAKAWPISAAGRAGWMLVTWFVAFFVFYSFYFSYDEWWYTRFLLPAYPAITVAAGIGIARVIERWRIVGVLLIVIALAWEGRQLARFNVLYTDEDQHLSRVPVEWAAKTLPPRSLVFSKEFSGALLYYSDHRPVRWDLGTPTVRPPYALLMQHEEEPFLEKFPKYVRVRTVAGGVLYARRPGNGSLATGIGQRATGN